MAPPKDHLMHYREVGAWLCAAGMAYGSWFDEPERWGRLLSSSTGSTPAR